MGQWGLVVRWLELTISTSFIKESFFVQTLCVCVCVFFFSVKHRKHEIICYKSVLVTNDVGSTVSARFLKIHLVPPPLQDNCAVPVPDPGMSLSDPSVLRYRPVKRRSEHVLRATVLIRRSTVSWARCNGQRWPADGSHEAPFSDADPKLLERNVQKLQ